MEGNSALDKLLVAYILKELNAEEEALVVQHLNADNSNRKYFEELLKTRNLITANEAFDKVDIREEWSRFEQSVTRKQQKLVSVKKQEDTADEIVGHETSGKSARFVKLLASIAVAASLLLVIVWGWDFVISQKPFLPEVAQEKNKTVSLPAFFRREIHQINTTGKTKRFVLPDGSRILLFDKSELSYKQPFDTGRRDVILKGKADFKVAKDAAKPFTVFSMALATTAIGTHFTVAAYLQSDKIKVRLYEGKIVIRPANQVSHTLKPEYYLFPGQELVYDNKNYTAKLIHFNGNTNIKHNSSNEASVYDNPSVPENSKGSWYMFNNQSLDQIFDQLKLMYNVDIIYSKSDVRKLYFIGKFDKSESLDSILHQIASLNNFKVTKKKEKFIISK